MARFVGMEQALGALEQMLSEELPAAMGRACAAIADDAAANHDYTNRTGQLQSRTVPGRVTTTATRVRGEVLGDTRYGKYIEEGTSKIRPRRFLANAADRAMNGGRVTTEFELGLTKAAERAGWKP